MRRFGIKVFYGDAGRLDLLHAARLLVLALADHEKAKKVLASVDQSQRGPRPVPQKQVV